MVNSRQKGAKAELQVAYMLKTYTGLDFTQTPGSGSGKIKGDLYVIDKHNLFLIEVKFYKDIGFNQKIFTQKEPRSMSEGHSYTTGTSKNTK